MNGAALLVNIVMVAVLLSVGDPTSSLMLGFISVPCPAITCMSGHTAVLTSIGMLFIHEALCITCVIFLCALLFFTTPVDSTTFWL